MKGFKKTAGIVVFNLIILFPLHLFSDTLKIATDEWCPYDCLPGQNDGKVGYLGDLLVKTMKAKGHKVEFVEVNYARGLELVREGKLDGTMACFREEAPDFVFPDFPLGQSNSTFFTLKNSSWSYTGAESLNQAKMIGIIDGYDYVDPTVMEYIDKKPNNILAMKGEKPLERLLEMLISGRISTIIEDKSVLEYKITQMGKTDLVKVSGVTDSVIDVFASFSPKKESSKEYAKILSEETIKMRKDGRLQILLDKYGIKDWQTK